MSDADLRVAVAGFGLAGEVFHAPLVASTPGMRVAAVTTSNADRAARAREAYDGVEVHPDADALLRDVDDLDVLVVATPNRSHVPIARAALARGIPVVMDKPLAADASSAAALVEDFAAARASSDVVTATTFSPSVASTKGAWNTSPARP